MKKSNSVSPFRKTLEPKNKNFRVTKSLIRLQSYLKSYSNQKNCQQKESPLIKKGENKLVAPKKDNGLELTSSSNFGVNKQIGENSQHKLDAFLDNLLLNINIFQKTFAGSKRKKLVIQKIFGWDQVFNEVFFNKNDDQNFKPNLNKKKIIEGLNLDKNTFGSKNLYNKLRFFLSELIDLNFKQQEAECKFQKLRFSESSAKLLQKLSELQHQTDREGTKQEIEKMRSTHIDLFNRKMRIKNRGSELQKIAARTGKISLDKFYMKEESNIEDVEKFLKSSLIK